VKLFNDPDKETWFPQAITPEERAGLEVAAANAEYLSNDDLQNLIKIMGTLDAIDNAKAEAVAQREAFAKHYENERRREIAQAARVAEQERQVRRARVAAALGIPVDSKELDSLK